jgi:hypothetical protein
VTEEDRERRLDVLMLLSAARTRRRTRTPIVRPDVISHVRRIPANEPSEVGQPRGA